MLLKMENFFEVSMDELRAFIGVNFVMRYHKLSNLRSYWETRSPSFSVNFVANVMKEKDSRKFWAISTFQTMKTSFIEITKPTIGHLK